MKYLVYTKIMILYLIKIFITNLCYNLCTQRLVQILLLTALRWKNW